MEASHRTPGRSNDRRTRVAARPAMPVPSDLRAARFCARGIEYTVLSYAVTAPQFPAGLTAAERAVLKGILQGGSNVEIAEARGTSPRTIANQVKSLFAKLGVHSRAELIAALSRPASLG